MTAVSVLSAGSKVSQCERMFLSSSISSLAKLSAYLTGGKAAKATAVSLVLPVFGFDLLAYIFIAVIEDLPKLRCVNCDETQL